MKPPVNWGAWGAGPPLKPPAGVKGPEGRGADRPPNKGRSPWGPTLGGVLFGPTFLTKRLGELCIPGYTEKA